MSATSEMLSEIKEVNLSYLLLAQRLREDKAMGMFRMGVPRNSPMCSRTSRSRRP
jgi:flagellar transcriptional activator FlhD